MTQLEELKDWIEKGAFYHGNETPKWIINKILNKIEYIEKSDNLIGIDSDPIATESDKSSKVVSSLNNLTMRVSEIENQDKRLPYDVLDLKERISSIDERINYVMENIRTTWEETQKIEVRVIEIENSENWNELASLMNDVFEMKKSIDSLSENKAKDSAFIVGHDEKKVIDEKLAALTRLILGMLK